MMESGDGGDVVPAVACPDSCFKVPSLDTESKKCSEDPKLSISTPTLNYSEPQWATLPSPEQHYSLEVIKEGQAIDQVDLTSLKKSFILIGRLASCDIHLEHVSISRHHCILQFGTSPDDAMPGWYIYDLGSTHGSFRNKQRVPARQFVRLHVGFVMKFGGSSRLFIVNGPEADQEEEAVRVERQELRKRKTQSEEEMDEFEKRPGIARDEKEETKTGEREMEEKEETGINWGMDYGEDDVIDDAVGGEDFELGTMEEREKFYKEDPKKALNNWYEREGFELQYEFAEHGSTFNRKWRCTIELPVDLPTGQCLRSEAVAVNKKEAQVLCALDACRLLDRHGLLRRANNQARKQLKLLKENDFYDSDEDIFLDRTGQLERQREKRRKRIEEGGPSTSFSGPADTLRGLEGKLRKAREELRVGEGKLAALVAPDSSGASDELIRHDLPDDLNMKVKKSQLRQEIVSAKHEVERLEKLVKIATPVALPQLKKGDEDDGGNKKKNMWIGSMKGHRPIVGTRNTNEIGIPPVVEEKGKEEGKVVVETEEDDEEEEKLPNTVSKEIDRGASASRTGEVVREPKNEGAGEAMEEESKNEGGGSTRHRPARPRDRTKKKLTESSIAQDGEYGAGEENKEDYAMWLPPENQSGDGVTKLNARFAGRY